MMGEYRGTTTSALHKPGRWLALFVSVALSVSLLMMLVACGEDNAFDDRIDISRTPENSLMGNPVTDVNSTEEIYESLGVSLIVPPDAHITRCSIIEVDSEDSIGEVEFNYGDSMYNYRAQKNTIAQDISGLYYDFDNTAEINNGVYDCAMHYIDDGPGYIIWFDDENSVIYSVGMQKGASESKLSDIANDLIGLQIME